MQLLRVLDQMLSLNLRLILEELVVILPEFSLVLRRERSQRRQRRILMKVEWEVFPNDANVVAVSLANLLEGRTDPPAERSLEVGELRNSDRGEGRARHRRALRVDHINAIGIRAAARRSGWTRRSGALHLGRELRQARVDLVEPGVEYRTDRAHLDECQISDDHKKAEAGEDRAPQRERPAGLRGMGRRVGSHPRLSIDF